MATKLYLQKGITPPVTPNFSSSWNSVVAASATWSTADTQKHGTTMGDCPNIYADSTSGTRTHGRLSFVYGPFTGAGSSPVTGYLDAQMRGSENAALYNGTWAMNVRVVYGSASPFSVRGTCMDVSYATPTAAPPEWSTSRTNRRFRGGTTTNTITPTLTNVTPSSGDYLVIEMGAAEVGTNTTRFALLAYGDDSGTDLATNDTTTTAYNPWVQFSSDLPPIFQVVRTNNTIATSVTVPTASAKVTRVVSTTKSGGASKNLLTSNEANGGEDGTIGEWEARSGYAGTLESDTAYPYAGSRSIKMTSTGSAPGFQLKSANLIPCSPSTAYVVSAYCKNAWTTAIYIAIVWYDSSKVEISYTNAGPNIGTTYTRAEVSYTVPANAAYLSIFVGSAITSGSFYADNFQVELGTTATTWEDPAAAWGGSASATVTVSSPALTKAPKQITGTAGISVSLVTASSKANKKVYSSAAIATAVTVPTASTKVTRVVSTTKSGGANLLTSNQATGTDTLGNTTGFAVANSGSIATSTSEYHQGSRSLEVTTTNAAYTGGKATNIPISPNTTYKVSLWVKAPNGSPDMYLQLNGDVTENLTFNSFTPTGNWQKVTSDSGTTGASDSTLSFNVCYLTAPGVVVFYVDELQLEVGTSVTDWSDPAATGGSASATVAVSTSSLTSTVSLKQITGTASISVSLANASSKATKKLYSSAAVPATLSLVTASSKVSKKLYSSAAVPVTVALITASSKVSKKLYSSAVPVTVSLVTASSKATKKLYSSAVVPTVVTLSTATASLTRRLATATVPTTVSLATSSLTFIGTLKNVTGSSALTLSLATASSKASKKLYSSSTVPATVSLVTSSANLNKKLYSSAAIPITLSLSTASSKASKPLATTGAIATAVSLVTASSKASKKLYSSAVSVTVSLVTSSSKATKKLYSSAAVPITTTTTSPILRYLVGTLRGQTIPITIGVPTTSTKANKKLYSSVIPITLTTSSASANVAKVVGISASITLSMPTVTGRANYNKASLRTATTPVTVTTSTVSTKASRTLIPAAPIPVTVTLSTASSKASKKLYSSVIPITVSLAAASTRVVKVVGTSATVPVTVSLVTASSKASKKLYSSAPVPITSTLSTTSLRYVLGRLTTQTIPIAVSVSSASTKATKLIATSAAIAIISNVPTAPITGVAGYRYTTGTSAIALNLPAASARLNRKLTPSTTAIQLTLSTASSKASKKLYSSAVVPVTVSLVTASTRVVKVVGTSAAITAVLTLPTATPKVSRKLTPSAAVAITSTTSTTSLRYLLAKLAVSTIPITVSVPSASATISAAIKNITGTSAITVSLATTSSKVSKPIAASTAIPLTLTLATSTAKRYRGLSVTVPAIAVTTSTASMRGTWALNGTTQLELTVPTISAQADKPLNPTIPITITIATNSPPLIEYISGLVHAHILPRGPAIKIRNQNPGIEILGAEGTASITSTTASAKVLSTEPDIEFMNEN